MRVQFTESVIKVNPSKKEIFIRNLWGVLLANSGILAFFVSLIFLVPTLLFGILLYQSLIVTSAEYEYAHTNDCFDVDRILFNARRKCLVSLKTNEILCVVPATSDRVANYSCHSTKDYSAHAGEKERYALLYTKDGKTNKLFLCLNQKMVRSLKLWMPEKVE